MSATLPKTTNLPTCPYKGLMPYTEEDALFFFGREGECEIITANLRAARLTLLYGMSGVGKSSVLQAGVTHTLLEQAQQRLDDFQFPGFAPVVFRDWQSDPLEGLSRQIEQTILSLFERFDLEPVLATSNLADLLKAWTERTKGKLLIILDQFEEYFLYHPHEEGEGTFAYEFPLAVNRPDLKVNFLISIREDQLSRLDRFKGRIPSLFDNYLRIDYLNREEAEKAIREPLAQFNHLLPKGQNYLEIEDALVQAVLEQVQFGRVQIGQIGQGEVKVEKTEGQEAKRIETPYLQLVLTRLWESERKAGSDILRLETLNRLGGAEQIVKTHLDEVMSKFPLDNQNIAARAFKHLVTRSGTKIAHTLSDLGDYARLNKAADKEKLAAILQQLSSGENRILRPIAATGVKQDEIRYEVFHDVLAKAVLDWLTRYEAEQEREAAKKAARQRVQRLLVWGVGLLAILVVLVVLSVISINSATEANTQSQRASKAELTALSDRDNAKNAQLTAVAESKVRAIAEDNANKERDEAKRQETLANQSASRQLAVQSNTQLDKRLDLSLLLAIEANKKADTNESRKALSDGLNHSQIQTYLRGHTKAVIAVAISPDGTLFATGGQDNYILVWDAATKKQLAKLEGHTDTVYSLAFSPDSKTLASGSNDKRIILWDVSAVKQGGQANLSMFLLGHKNGVFSVAYSPDGKNLVSSGYDHFILLWNVATGRQIGVFNPNAETVWSVAFNPQQPNILASAEGDKVIRLWDMTTQQQIGEPFIGHTSTINTIAFSPDGNILVSGSADGNILVWDISSRKLKDRLAGHTSAVNTVAFSPDGKRVVSSGCDSRDGGRTCLNGELRLWDLGSESESLVFPAFGKNSYGLAFSPDGKNLLAGNEDGTVQWWELESSRITQTAQAIKNLGYIGSIDSVVFSGDGNYLYSADQGATILVWEPFTKKQVGRLESSTKVVNLAMSPDGKLLAAAGEFYISQNYKGGEIRLWDTATGKPIGLPLRNHKEKVRSVVFSPDGKYLASASDDRTIVLWDVATQKPVGKPFAGQDGIINIISFSPDGRTIASAYEDGSIHLWDAFTGLQTESPLIGHQGGVAHVEFSPDGKTLASGGSDNTVRFWNVKTGKQIGEALIGHTATVQIVAFSPDGTTLASGSDDGKVILWDVATHQQKGTPLLSDKWPIHALAFDRSGQTLAYGDESNRIHLWNIAEQKPLGLLEEAYYLSKYLVADGKTLTYNTKTAELTLADQSGSKLLGVAPKSSSFFLTGFNFSQDKKIVETHTCINTIISSGYPFCTDSEINLWDLERGEKIGRSIGGFPGTVQKVIFSPDEKYIATLNCIYTTSDCTENELKLFEVVSQTQIGQTIKGLNNQTVVIFSPNSKSLAVESCFTLSCDRGEINLFDTIGLKKIGNALTIGETYTKSLTFSLDGGILAAVSAGFIYFLDVATTTQKYPPLQLDASVLRLAFEPDGKSFLTLNCFNNSCSNAELRRYDFTNFSYARIFLGLNFGSYFRISEFNSDGNILILSTDSASYKINVYLDSAQQRACQLANRNMTKEEWQQYFGSEPYRKTCDNLP